MKSHNGEKKLKGGTLSHFLTSIVAKHQKIEGGPFGEKKFRKSLTMPKKTERGDPLVSRYCMLTRKKRKNLFGSLRWAK